LQAEKLSVLLSIKPLLPYFVPWFSLRALPCMAVGLQGKICFTEIFCVALLKKTSIHNNFKDISVYALPFTNSIITMSL